MNRKKQAAKSEPDTLRTFVCLTCGAEQYLEEDGEQHSSLKCTKCGATVFREFDTQTKPDEAQLDQLEATRRSAAWGDASPQTTRDDLRDLDAR